MNNKPFQRTHKYHTFVFIRKGDNNWKETCDGDYVEYNEFFTSFEVKRKCWGNKIVRGYMACSWELKDKNKLEKQGLFRKD